MIYLTVIAFVIYNYMAFDYISSIYCIKINLKLSTLILSLINSFLIYLPIYITNFEYEHITMLLFTIFLTLEMLIIFRQEILKVLLGSLSFAINFFAIRVMILAVIAILNDMYVYEVTEILEFRILITLINFLISIPYILLVRKILPGSAFLLLLSSKKNLYFLIIMLFAIYLSLYITGLTLLSSDLNTTHVNTFSYSLIRSGLFTISTFAIMVSSINVFSNLRLKAIKFTNISNEIKKESSIIEKLREQSDIDILTGFYKKNVVTNVIEEYIVNKDEFFLSFIDIDGLKVVNDTFGHEEGDFYILNVSKIINTHFKTAIKSRIGGDEFLIAGLAKDYKRIEESFHNCDADIALLSKKANKKYNSSVSFGVVFVPKHNKYSAKELIKIADEKMYASKRTRNKERVIVEINK